MDGPDNRRTRPRTHRREERVNIYDQTPPDPIPVKDHRLYPNRLDLVVGVAWLVALGLASVAAVVVIFYVIGALT